MKRRGLLSGIVWQEVGISRSRRARTTLASEVTPHAVLAVLGELHGEKMPLTRLLLDGMKLGVVGHRRHPRLADRDRPVLDDRNQAFEMVGVVMRADDQIDAPPGLAEGGKGLGELLVDMVLRIRTLHAGIGEDADDPVRWGAKLQEQAGAELHLEHVDLDVDHTPARRHWLIAFWLDGA
jgi:hypothetical protein